MTFELRTHFTLEPWQQDAVDAWLTSDSPSLGPRHGILEIYTGAGKTIVALGAMAAVLGENPQTKVAIVVPTVALAQQWVNAIPERTTLSAARVGMVGGERNDGFSRHDVLVYVLASARTGAGEGSRLAADVEAARARGQEVFLVVDECHKAGAPSSSKIFDARTHARLGLSATPHREGADAQDELGQVLPLERQRHGRALGGVCYRLSLRDGYTLGMLPRYEIHHHGISLTDKEQKQHSLLTHRVTQARKDVVGAGGSPDRYLAYLTGRGGNVSGAVVKASAALQSAYLERKHFLYQASERLRVVERILVDAWNDERLGAPQGAVLFNERIGDAAPQLPAGSDEGLEPEEEQLVAGAESLCLRVKQLAQLGELPFPPSAVAIEHSRLPSAAREAALDGLRSGEVQVLVSVKALQEGIDIPDVGLGVSVASTASARQRIQTMGRILRPARDATGQRLPPDEAPVKRLHLLYVRGTVDEEIYKRTDWNDATGAERNHWWDWSLTDQTPRDGEELAPTDVDEAAAWERVAKGPLPKLWEGPTQGVPLVHKQGAVWVVLGSETLPVADPAPIIRLLETGKRRGAYPDARGRFSVSPELNVVLKRGASPKDPARQITLALGRLKGPPMWPGKGEEPKEVDAGSAASATATSPESAASSPPTESRSAQSPSAQIPSAQIPSAQIPSAQSPSAQSPSAQRKTSGGKSAAPWFVLVQEGYLAAVARDQAVVERVAKALSGQRKAWIHEAVAVIAEGTGWPAGADETPPSGLDTLLPYAGKAFVSGRTDLLRRACESFKIGKARKPQRVAIANALAILAGKADEVWLPEEE
jgi:superfamily II DNA or RNA helicase